MKVALLLLACIFVAQVAALSKQVVLSSMRIKNTHETPGNDPEIEFACQYVENGLPIADVTNPIGGSAISLPNVDKTDVYYVVETYLFTWDNETSGNFIVCKTIESDDVGSDESLGVSSPIPFNSVVADGRFFSTTNPPESDFYVRCKDCNIIPNNTAPKILGVYTLKISDNLQYFPFTSPDIYMECQNQGDPSVYTMTLKDVKKGNTEYIVNKRFTQWTWDPTTSSGAATCGIYNKGSVSGLDGLGTTIIQFSNISTAGTKYFWPGDPGTYTVFKDCTNEDDCNSSYMMKASILTIISIFYFFF